MIDVSLRGQRVLAAALLALLPLACTSNTNVGTPASFNRPGRIAFVCFDLTDTTMPRVVPLEECRPLTLNADGAGRQTFLDGRRLHALVTQVTRGEVAAVDLTTRTILDSDRRIPGATFVPVGGTPIDVIVPERTPTCAWVATAADWRLTSIPTARFRPEHDRSVPDQIASVALPGPPAELVLSPDERTLWVSIPSVGAVARIAIDPNTCTTGAPDLVEVGDVVPAAATAPTVATCTGADLCRVCPTDFVPEAAAAVTPRTYVPADPAPRPRALELDVEEGVILVGDENLPLIHRIELATGSLLAPLSVGAPIRDLALTPWVPDTYASPATTPTPTRSRFLYAIDELDQTVMAIEYGDESSPSFGAVLSTDGASSTRADRLVLPVGARALDVITPGFDPDAADPRVGTELTTDRFAGLCDYGTDPRTPTTAPTNLRGVFVSLAMTDGTVRIVDVYDLDAPCRGRTVGVGAPPTDCTDPANVLDQDVYVRRHRPRATVFMQRFVGVFDGPRVLSASGSDLLVQNDGSSGASPSFAEVSCPAGMGGVWPSTGGTRICSQTDPFGAAAETWILGWQGALPLTAGSGGNFRVDGDIVVLEGRTDFCARGVVSATAAAAAPLTAPEANYAGDLLAITTAVDDARLDVDAACRAVVGIDAVGQLAQPILVPIREAFSAPADITAPYTGRLLLDLDAPIIDASTGVARAGVTLATALDCLGDVLITYDVRTQAGYTVSGSRSGHLHRVVRSAADGACAVDDTLPLLHWSRAFHDADFVGTRLAFRLSPSEGLPRSGTEVRFRIGVHDGRAVGDLGLRVDVGLSSTLTRLLTLPSEVMWNARTQHLYLIEPERRGLVEIETLPFGTVSGNRFE